MVKDMTAQIDYDIRLDYGNGMTVVDDETVVRLDKFVAGDAGDEVDDALMHTQCGIIVHSDNGDVVFIEPKVIW